MVERYSPVWPEMTRGPSALNTSTTTIETARQSLRLFWGPCQSSPFCRGEGVRLDQGVCVVRRVIYPLFTLISSSDFAAGSSGRRGFQGGMPLTWDM